MSAMGLYYLVRSVQDCAQPAARSLADSLSALSCDLSPRSTWITILSTVSSVGMLAYKLGLIKVIRLRRSERDLLRSESRRLNVAVPHASGAAGAGAASGVMQPRGPSLGATVAVPTPSEAQQQSASDLEFIVSRAGPSRSAAPRLASAAVAAADEEVSVRGVCDGCGQDVLSNDEGRKREDNKYYHEGCVKGQCGGCGRVVHAESARASIRGVYWHAECL
jgi:hypothetical protein